jgi:hypothetical protein
MDRATASSCSSQAARCSSLVACRRSRRLSDTDCRSSDSTLLGSVADPDTATAARLGTPVLRRAKRRREAPPAARSASPTASTSPGAETRTGQPFNQSHRRGWYAGLRVSTGCASRCSWESHEPRPGAVGSPAARPRTAGLCGAAGLDGPGVSRRAHPSLGASRRRVRIVAGSRRPSARRCAAWPARYRGPHPRLAGVERAESRAHDAPRSRSGSTATARLLRAGIRGRQGRRLQRALVVVGGSHPDWCQRPHYRHGRRRLSRGVLCTGWWILYSVLRRTRSACQRDAQSARYAVARASRAGPRLARSPELLFSSCRATAGRDGTAR